MRLSPLVLGLALALPATAHADSISYLKDGNVWLSSADGARQFQVTSDGGYSNASQSDTGVIVATKGHRLYRFARTGRAAQRDQHRARAGLLRPLRGLGVARRPPCRL